MKKRIVGLLFILAIVFCLTGCTNYGKDFKTEYESLNGLQNDSGVAYRILNIPENNPYQTVEASQIVDMINQKETFYVYFGFNKCPWCRSVIEKSIEVAKNKNIKKIYYVDVLDIRDKMEVQDGKAVKTADGSEDYQKLIELLSNVLDDYSLKDSNGNEVSTNEKRIYAPNFVYVENGEAKKITEGSGDSLTDPYADLSDDILQEEENLFNEFFSN